MASEISFKDLTSPVSNEIIQNHNAISFKLAKTVADFTQQLSEIHERQAEDLQLLVETFRKRNAEIRKERTSYQSSLFTVWEQLLQEIEVDSQIHGDIARNLSHNLGTGLLEKTFHLKIQSRKAFLYRESLEAILNKADDLLRKCHHDYSGVHRKLLLMKNPNQLGEYYDAHNAYVQQLHATNGMLQSYQTQSLPRLLEELEDVYSDISDTISNAVQSSSDFLANKMREQSNRYESLSSQCRSVNPKTDLSHFIKRLNPDKVNAPIRLHQFVAPSLLDDNNLPVDVSTNLSEPNALHPNALHPNALHPNWPLLQNELIIERLSKPTLSGKREALKQEILSLESKIQQLEESTESLLKLRQRSLDSNLFNKANEIQEDISQKRFDLHVATTHLAAVKSQLELFFAKDVEIFGENGIGEKQRERKTSSASGTSTGSTSIKSKWLKAFKSLKPSNAVLNVEKGEIEGKSLKNVMGKDNNNLRLNLYEGTHIFQEYTYKKITACDVCHEILRGHSRQGLKCKMCKMNVHSGRCQENSPKCQPKTRLLRRQKSTSEIEMRVNVPEAEDEKSHLQSVDPVYQLIKQAADARRNPALDLPIGPGNSSTPTVGSEKWTLAMGLVPSVGHSVRSRSNPSSMALTNSRNDTHEIRSSALLAVNAAPVSSSSAPHSPQRKKLSLRMKSFSLDSPESTEHVQRRRHQQYSHCSSSHSQSPQSPVHSRKFQIGKNVRMSSVELPDSNEKSSASPSPCPSPKPQRLLPTNLYVVLYNFRSRHHDELDLKAGYTVTVIDTTDPDWWQGKCLGQIGFFPSKYVTKLFPGERPLQVSHTIQVSDGDSGTKLLRDQVVIQVADDIDGIIMIRTGTNDRSVPCPIKYLQEVS